ncbi:MAG: DMT family transporter [Desulfobacteraceae bacterium]|nr:DMT family transporter [Desulfobacteraceae bacterium]
MKSSIGYMVLGTIAGCCLCLEGSLNSLLGRHVGVLKAAIAPFGTGLIAIVVVVLLLGKDKGIGLGLWLEAPWYSYLGGMWAVAFVCLVKCRSAKTVFQPRETGYDIGLIRKVVNNLHNRQQSERRIQSGKNS